VPIPDAGNGGGSFIPKSVTPRLRNRSRICSLRLLAARAHGDRRDVLGMTALNHAVAKDSVEIVEILPGHVPAPTRRATPRLTS
jgi:hypothetical protein